MRTRIYKEILPKRDLGGKVSNKIPNTKCPECKTIFSLSEDNMIEKKVKFKEGNLVSSLLMENTGCFLLTGIIVMVMAMIINFASPHKSLLLFQVKNLWLTISIPLLVAVINIPKIKNRLYYLLLFVFLVVFSITGFLWGKLLSDSMLFLYKTTYQIAASLNF